MKVRSVSPGLSRRPSSSTGSIVSSACVRRCSVRGGAPCPFPSRQSALAFCTRLCPAVCVLRALSPPSPEAKMCNGHNVITKACGDDDPCAIAPRLMQLLHLSPYHPAVSGMIIPQRLQQTPPHSSPRHVRQAARHRRGTESPQSLPLPARPQDAEKVELGAETQIDGSSGDEALERRVILQRSYHVFLLKQVTIMGCAQSKLRGEGTFRYLPSAVQS